MYTAKAQGYLDGVYGKAEVPPKGCTPLDHANYIEGYIRGESQWEFWSKSIAAKEAAGYRNDPTFDATDIDWRDKQPNIGKR